MILYPAIDIKDRVCVRLLRGDMDDATVFDLYPSHQARAFYDAGCEWLHVVDLNGAFEGKPVNGDAVRDILHACPDMKIQLGGGIRTMEMIEYWLDAGITRVILGTVAVENPELVREAAKKFPDQIVVGIDARDGKVATHGWAEKTNIFTTDLATRYQDDGVAAIIYTDISRDGAMQGPNIEATQSIAKWAKIPVIVSGGISKIDDFYALKGCGTAFDGVICGRALYDKKFTVNQALNALK